MAVIYTVTMDDHQTSVVKRGRRATSLKRMDEGVTRSRSVMLGRTSKEPLCPPFACKFIYSGTAFNAGETTIHFKE